MIMSGLLLVSTNYLHAGHLPTKSYTPANGLVHERIRSIRRDSHGFLWFGTGDGLSRFDGFTFTNYNSAQGLQEPGINDFVERRDGNYWLATNGGAILFNPLAAANEQKFTLYKIGDASKNLAVKTFYEDRAGRFWAATAQGLYYLDETSNQRAFRLVELGLDNSGINSLIEDAEGSLWIAADVGLIRHLPNGETVKYEFADSSAERQAMRLLFDGENRLWVGFYGGLLVLKPEPAADVKSARHLISGSPQKNFADKSKLILPEINGTESWYVAPKQQVNILNLKKLSDGSIWIASRGAGLFAFRDGVLQNYGIEQGLTDNYINVIEEDSGNNIWIGTETNGAIKITRRGFTSFRESDGIGRRFVWGIFETNAGEIGTILNASEMLYLSGDRFVPFKLGVAPDLVVSHPLGTESPFQDHLGEWWISCKDGLYHFPKTEKLADLANAKADAIYTEKDGLPNFDFVAINEDSRGDIWIGTKGSGILTRWERATGKFYEYAEADGVPAFHQPSGFAETANGDVWFSFALGDVLRYRNGKFHLFTEADGVPAGTISTLFADSRGRLWIPSQRGGAARVDNPADDKPNFQTYTPSNGLSSINTRCVTEDAQGRIYVGTVRGVDRLEVEGNRIKHYTVADGLSYSEIGNCMRDSKNNLWFATYRGLSKFVPEDAENTLPSPALINNLRVAGVNIPVSELGTNQINGLQFEPSQNQMQIDFFSLSFAIGENLRYQYRLEGANADWSEPTASRTVNFANLASGDYRFFVRAVDSAGKNGEAANINFKILPPVYRRWWFMVLVALLLSGLVLAVERYRAARLRELETAFGKLSVSENRFRQMNEQSPLGIIVFAPDGSIRAVNRAYENFWGITYEQIKHWDFFNDEQLIRIGVVEKLRRVFAGETVHFPPEPYNPGDNNHGIEFVEKAAMPWFESFAYPVVTETGELLEVILVMEDVTATKRADEIERTAKSDRLRELEQVRRRIAADLHDDIGSSLTQISIFSEVLQQRVDKSNVKVVEPLEFIAASSRELVDAMSDIVWAINPNKDFLSELSGKMRRFASDVFTARNIEFAYTATPIADIALGANLRREVFLIFKESINNIVKHADCKSVKIELIIENAEIRLILKDDGKGFENNHQTDGHGLVSMNARANGLGGKLEIVSDKTSGTTVKLIVPLLSEQ